MTGVRGSVVNRGIWGKAVVAGPPAVADPLPATIDGAGAGALTSSWFVGQSYGHFKRNVLVSPTNRLMAGGSVVTIDDVSCQSTDTLIRALIIDHSGRIHHDVA